MQTVHEWIAWADKNIDNNLMYKQEAVHQAMFFRDKVAILFIDRDATGEFYRAFVKVDGGHTSKSVHLPVYHFETSELKVWARDNFYNWNVTVESTVHLVIPDWLRVDDMSDYLFLEGMEYTRKSKYSESNTRFSFCVSSKYDLYAVMKCIASQVQKAK
jgi:hypothetical protein